jgi:two-component system, LytTR family, sensor kinase
LKRFVYITRVLVVIAPLVALIPVGRMAIDYMEMTRVVAGADLPTAPRSFDWVLWDDTDGLIVASYVFPNGPAHEAGLRTGDVFYSLEYQQYFNADDVKRAIEGIPPGEVRMYQLLRDGRFFEAPVRFTRYPTFIYPLSTTIWQFSLWGFTVGAFFHLLGLLIAAPLAFRSVKARSSLILIALSSMWMFGNLGRLFAIEFIGPPMTPGGPYDTFFQFMTLAGLTGWIGFPAILLRHVVADAVAGRKRLVGPLRHIIHIPPVLFGIAALWIVLMGTLGPITMDALISPMLFYTCAYIAASALLILSLYLAHPNEAAARMGHWGKTGAALTFLVALFFGLSMIGIVPLFGATTDISAGWLIIGAQLLSVVPIVLVSLATLRHGKVDHVVGRTLTYLTVFGFFFFSFVGGLAIIDMMDIEPRLSRNVVTALFAIALLVLFERAARQIQVYASNVFATERQRIRKKLSHYQEQMRGILNLEVLLNRSIYMIGDAFGARSAVLFLSPDSRSNRWLQATYHPEPPYLTERVVSQVWPEFRREAAIWARNPELDESSLPPELGDMLAERGAVLAIPIAGDERPVGLLVLGLRKQKRLVYNLDDVEMLRAFCAHLAIAVERIRLIEREKSLVRESAEAHLVALRAQINPHFLFNALNTIASLIQERPEDAEATLENLAAIFRYTLNTGSRAFVSMEEEFGLVSHYLAIEQVRFADKLTVDMALDSALSEVPVPAFAVQTLVENAVKHGLSKRRDGGRLEVRCAHGEDGNIEVSVIDTGVGIPALFGSDGQEVTSFYGIGLTNISSRLEKLYGRSGLLRIRSDEIDGTSARIILPRTAAWSHSPTTNAFQHQTV